MKTSLITLHPQARDLLFKYYSVIAKIFRDVLGLLEIDYMAIALLTPKDELLFFSSKPGIEWEMIEHDLWLSDARFQYEFFQQEQVQVWDQRPSDYCIGLSISSIFDEYRVIYTFASKFNDEATRTKIHNNIAMLIRMGRFCLKNILDEIPFFGKKSNLVQQNAQLKLVINNKVLYENVT